VKATAAAKVRILRDIIVISSPLVSAEISEADS